MTASELRPSAATPAPRAPAGADDGVDVDITVAGLTTVRLVGVRPSDRAAVERQFGAAAPASSRPADLTVRYVERVARDRSIRYLGPGTAGFTTEGFVILQGRFRRQVRVLFPGADIGGRCEVVCEHGVGRVPHLVALVNLALLARGGVALHASTFERDGTATVATGWSKGGKTEALLSACDTGATYVADEWTHISPDRRASGSWEPVRTWDWQLAQLPWLREQLGARRRLGLGVLRRAEQVASVAHVGPRTTTAIARNRFVDVAPELVARGSRPTHAVPIGQVLLMTATDRPLTWTRPMSGREVADRMAASLAYERAPLAATMASYRFAFPRATTRAWDEVPEIEHERLRALLGPLPAAEVLHPYPVDLAELGRTIALAQQEARP